MTSVGSELALLVDVGSAWTKGTLISRVRGSWRIVAHGAQPTDWGDDELVRRLASALRPSADPRLARDLERLIAAAPRIECHTSVRPARLALASVSRDVSGAAARRAAESAGWLIVENASADDGRALTDRLVALQAAEVDAWLLSGGFEGAHADQALEMTALVAAARGDRREPVIWAGSSRLSHEVAGLFEPGAVSTVANPRPSPEREDPGPLRIYLEALLSRTVEPESARHLSPVSFRRALAQLSRETELRIMGIDLGARFATVVLADGRGEAESRVFARGGLTAAALTAPGGPGRVTRGMPEPIDELTVADTLQNLGARPATLPQTEEDLAVLHGAARHQLASVVADDLRADGIDLLVGAGRVMAAAPRPAMAAQMLIDGVRPLGVTALAIDGGALLGPLGSLEDGEIGEGMASLREDLLVPLGTAVICRGGRSGHVAMRVTLHRSGWPSIGPIEVRSGQLQIVPLGAGQFAELEISLEEGASLGTPRRSRRAWAEVSGGSVGVILDARGVPTSVPRRAEDRRAVLAAWRDAMLREPPQPAPRAR
ncbi:MAG: glutamate mutase L [Chloroflexota bacterium]